MREPRGAVKPPIDQLLLGRALELEPVARAGGDVRRADALGDQPFPAVAARAGEQRGAVAGHLLGHAQRVLPAQQVRQHRAALLQREGPQVAPVREQDVEDVVEELGALAAAEAVAPADEGHGLAVDHESVGRVGVERGGERRVAVVERQLVARVQPRARRP